MMIFMAGVPRTFTESAITAIEVCFRTASSNAVISWYPSYNGENPPFAAPNTRRYAPHRFHKSAATYVPVDM